MHRKEILKRMNGHKTSGHPVSSGKFASVRRPGEAAKANRSINVGENSSKKTSSPMGVGGGY